MIADNIKYFKNYFKGEVFDKIYECIRNIKNTHPLGEFELKGKDIFYKVLEYKTKENDWITESHKKYADIQIILSGEEIIKVYDFNSTTVKTGYDLNSDCTFYNIANPDFLSEIILKNDFFCAFFPQDIHQTQVATNNNPILIKKLVFKVHEKFFT